MIEINTNNSVNHFRELENAKNQTEQFDEFLHFKEPANLSVEELKHVIEELGGSERDAVYNKGRRSIKAKRILFEEELKRQVSK